MSDIEEPKECWLPQVSGRRISTSNAAFEHSCRVLLSHELDKPDGDTALINILCEAIRLVREYSDAMQGRRQ